MNQEKRNANSQIKFNTTMLKPSLYDYNVMMHTYMLKEE